MGRFVRAFAAAGVRMPRRPVALVATVAAALALTAAAAAAAEPTVLRVNAFPQAKTLPLLSLIHI